MPGLPFLGDVTDEKEAYEEVSEDACSVRNNEYGEQAHECRAFPWANSSFFLSSNTLSNALGTLFNLQGRQRRRVELR